MSERILCVDDDPNILAGIQRNLRKQFSIDIAIGAGEGLKILAEEEPYAIVVADMQMPRMNGIDFLKQVKVKAPDTIRIMLTGNADQKTAVEAVNEGHVFRFLTKPCAPETLATTLNAGLQQHRLAVAERELLKQTLNGSIKVMTDILASIDPQSFGQAQRLRDYMCKVGESFGVHNSWELELAAMLSPIGYLAIPGSVLERSRAHCTLTGPEKDMLSRVPQFGSALLANIPRLESVSRIVLYQHKNFDGSGFPNDNVAGDEIPLGARILKVLHDLLVIESARIHRFKAFDKMRLCAGRYDFKILQAVAASFDHCLELAEESKLLAFGELRVGHVLQSDLTTANGALIVPAGTQVSPMLLEKLRNFAELNDLKEPVHVAA